VCMCLCECVHVTAMEMEFWTVKKASRIQMVTLAFPQCLLSAFFLTSFLIFSFLSACFALSSHYNSLQSAIRYAYTRVYVDTLGSRGHAACACEGIQMY